MLPPAPPLDPELPVCDPATIHNWFYPTNMPVRGYQRTITEHALFKNTLVSLPTGACKSRAGSLSYTLNETGLGKTLIAAVVMYNFYRWFPEGKVIFMAPTKPLAAQQLVAARQIMGFPASDVVEMTGLHLSIGNNKIWLRHLGLLM
jgi:Fanconi anemia group M protein